MPLPPSLKRKRLFQHTAARRRLGPTVALIQLSFNTQPPEGGWRQTATAAALQTLFQHTAARRRLGVILFCRVWGRLFQHTAARRRLVILIHYKSGQGDVCFNTQPPEGGWLSLRGRLFLEYSFNTQPPEGGWCR